MEHIDFSEIIRKIGPDKDLSKLTEEELYYYDMVRAVKSKSADEERKKINEVIKKAQTKSHLQTNKFFWIMNNKTWIGAAAAIGLLIVAYLYLWQPSKSPDEIFANSFSPEKEYVSKAKEKAMNFGMVDSGTESRDSFLKAMQFYEENNYDEAMKILGPYVETYPADTDARFYLSMAQMNREKYAAAISNLSMLNATKDLENAEDIKWYYALCLLKMVDGRKQAKTLFEQLAASQGKHANAARANLMYL